MRIGRRDSGLFGTTVGLVLVWGLLGCGGEASPGSDAGEPDAGPSCASGVFQNGECLEMPAQATPAADCPSGEYLDGVCLPSPPTPPTPPRLIDWTCPAGWQAVTALADEPGLEPFSYCLPPAEGSDCPDGTFPVVGRGDCDYLGLACPDSADWHDETTLRERAPDHDGRIWYVHPDGAQSGAGTRPSPITLGGALSRAGAGDIIALAAGTYRAAVDLDAAVALVGSCAAQTLLVPGAGGEPAVYVTGRGGAAVTDLTINAARPGIVVDTTAEGTTIRGVAVENARPTALAFSSSPGEHVVENVLVRATRTDPSRLEFAVMVVDSEVAAQRLSVLESHATAAVYVAGPAASLAAADLLVADSAPGVDGAPYGMAVFVGAQASLAVERGVFRRSTAYGLFAVEQSEVSLVDVEVSDTAVGMSDGYGGEGLRLSEGAHGSVERGVFLRNHFSGLSADSVGTRLDAVDVVVDETAPDANTTAGAITVERGAEAEVRRALLRGNRDLGVDAYANLSQENVSTRVTVRDLVVLDTGSPQEPWAGRAIGLSAWGAVVEADAVVVRRTDGKALQVGAGAELTLRDGELTDTHPTGLATAAIHLRPPAFAELERTRVERADGYGILAEAGGARLRLVDVDVAHIARAPDGTGGWGGSLDSIDLVGERVRVREAVEVGLIVGQGLVDISDLSIEGIRRPGVETFSSALIADESELRLSRAAIRQGEVIGASIWFGSFEAADLVVDAPGRGGLVLIGTEASLTRAVFRAIQLTALYVASEDPRDAAPGGNPDVLDPTRLTASDVVVRDVGAAPDWDPALTPEQAALAVGVTVADGSSLDVSRFLVAGCQSVGLLLSPAGDAMAQDGLIANNAIGLNIQNPAFDVGGRFIRVRNTGNITDRSFDALATPALDNLYDAYEVAPAPE